MSVFNPQVPVGRDDMPSYLRGYSDSISQPHGDTSTGQLLATLGGGLEGGAGLIEGTAKGIIDKDVRSTIEPIREGFTKQLEGIRAAQNNIIPNAVSTSEGSTTGSTEGAGTTPRSVPVAITSGLDRLQSIQDGFINGSYNDTYYDQRLNTGVVSLRSKYPGFVDYIDQRVSAITGRNPANSYVNNLLQDINSAVTAKKTEEDKVLDIARTKGIVFDKGYEMYQALKNKSKTEDEYMKWYSEESAKDTDLARGQAALNYKKSKGLDVQEDAKKTLTDFIATKISSDLNGTISLNGMNAPEPILDILRKAENNPNSYTPQQYVELAAKFETHRDLMRSQLVLLTNKNGLTKDVGGGPARDAELDSQIKFYDSLINSIRGGGSGGFALASFQMNQAKAITENRKYNLTNSTLGELADNFEMLSQKFGPALTASHIMPAILAEQKKLPDLVRPLFAEKVIDAHGQPGGEEKPTTIAQHMREIESDKRINAQSKAYLYKGLTNTVEAIKGNGPDEDKAAIARYLFDPANNGVLQNWKMDYRTTSPDGRLKIEHPGKYAIWTQLTDPEVSKNINKLDEKTKAYYKNWVDITGRELIGEDVRNLNHFTGHDNLHFKWSNTGNGTPKLELLDNEGGLASPVGKKAGLAGDQYRVPDNYRMQVEAVVTRINRALPNLENVYKTFGGGDTETMLLQTLSQYGLDFEGKITGLPKAWGDAIAASRKAPKVEAK